MEENNHPKKSELPTEEEVIAAFVNPDEEVPKESKKIKELKRDNLVAIISAVCTFIIIVLVGVIVVASNSKKETAPVVSIEDLTDEQKEKLGVTKEDKNDTTKIEDENNYSDEYKEYLNLSDEEKRT